MTTSTRHWITVSRRPSPVIGPAPETSLQSCLESSPRRALRNPGSGRPVIGSAAVSLSVLHDSPKCSIGGRYVTGAMLATTRQVSTVDGFRLTTKMTSAFLYIKLRRQRTFRGVLSAGRTDQVYVIQRGHRSSVAVDDHLLHETVRRPRLARRLLSHVTLRRHLEPRPDVGQLGAVCACAGGVEQLRRQLQFVRTLCNCTEKYTERRLVTKHSIWSLRLHFNNGVWNATAFRQIQVSQNVFLVVREVV